MVSRPPSSCSIFRGFFLFVFHHFPLGDSSPRTVRLRTKVPLWQCWLQKFLSEVGRLQTNVRIITAVRGGGGEKKIDLLSPTISGEGGGKDREQ